MLKKIQKGFTLIEMMVVISIIGVISAILIPTILNYVHKAERAADKVTARLIGNTITEILIEYPEYCDLFYGNKAGGAADYCVVVDGEQYWYRNVARANGNKLAQNTQQGGKYHRTFEFYADGHGWEQTDPKYNKITDALNIRLDEIIGGNMETNSYIPMRSTGYKHDASECNDDTRAGGRRSSTADLRPGKKQTKTYSPTDRWLIGYRITKKNGDPVSYGAVEVWAGDSYGRAANGPRVRLWPNPPSYY